MSSIIGVIAQQRQVCTQTFIRAHIDFLPAQVKELYIEELPLDRGDRVERFLIDNDIEAVLAEFGNTGIDVMAACRATSVPLVVRFAGRDAYSRPPDYRGLFAASAAIVAVSRAMEQHLISLGAPAGKLHYCPSGANTSLFYGAQPAAAPPVFVAVGRFVDKKAPYLTLMAFSEVFKACPEARLIMVGAGHLLETCRRIAGVLRIDRAVEFRGACSHAEVATIMRGARCFVQHSVRSFDGDSEGTPNSVMEAGAAGLPVVATRHGGIPEVVIEAETGFLVDEGDVAGMADRMFHLARDTLAAGRLGARASEHVLARFSLSVSIRRLWEIIEDVLPNVPGQYRERVQFDAGLGVPQGSATRHSVPPAARPAPDPERRFPVGAASQGGIFIYCQSAFGVGHFVRTYRLIDALRSAFPALPVTLCCGGRSSAFLDLPDAVECIELEPLIFAGPQASLAAPDGASPRPILRRRRALLLGSLARLKPRAVLFEHFPFGRWAFREEILALLEACLAQLARPLLWSSVREIPLVPERNFGLMLDVVTRFDRIFVHADPMVMPLDLGRPTPPAVAARLDYTGYVTPDDDVAARPAQPVRRVLAHAGGGRDGQSFWDTIERFRPAMGPAELVRCGEDPDALADHRATLELLRASWRSISMAGYNTVAEWLTFRVPTVFVPRRTDREQITRLQALQDRIGGPMAIADSGPEGLRRAWDTLRDDAPFRGDVRVRGQQHFARAVGRYL